MTRRSRRRESERGNVRGNSETVAEGDADEIDPGDIDPGEVDSDDLRRTPDGELIHEPTGLILEEDNIDPGPDWRAFNHSERQNKSRVGVPTAQTMHDRGLTTTIDWKDKDAYGRSLSSEKRSQMHRLRKWQEGIPRSLEEISDVSRVERKEIGRTYRYVSQELGLEMRPVDPKKYVPRFCSELELNEEVQGKASEIIETTAEQGLLSGKPRPATPPRRSTRRRCSVTRRRPSARSPTWPKSPRSLSATGIRSRSRRWGSTVNPRSNAPAAFETILNAESAAAPDPSQAAERSRVGARPPSPCAESCPRSGRGGSVTHRPGIDRGTCSPPVRGSAGAAAHRTFKPT